MNVRERELKVREIATYAADIVKDIDADPDGEMSRPRHKLDWLKQFNY